MTNKRRIVLLVLVLSVVFSLVGCSSKGSGEAETNNELSLAVWGYEQNKEFKAIVEAFEEKYDATVKIIDIDPGSYSDKITAMLAGGEKTDVLSMKDVGGYVNYANKGQLLDLSDYEDGLSAEDKENYGESINSYRTDDGKIYALPFRKDTYVLFYNKDIFDAAGIEYPSELTWESYKELAEKLTTGDNEAEKVYGAYHHTWFPIVQALAANQSGGDLLSGDYGFMKDYYQTFVDMQNEGTSMDYGTIKSTSTTYGSVFETEKTATMIMGSFYISRSLNSAKTGESDINWGMATVPQLANAKETVSYGGPAGMGINKNAANPELARKFVEFTSGKEGALVLAKMGITPGYQNEEIINEIFSNEGMPQDEGSRAALSPDVDGFEVQASEKAAEVYTILGEEHSLIMVGDSSIEDGIKEMEDRVKGIE